MQEVSEMNIHTPSPGDLQDQSFEELLQLRISKRKELARSRCREGRLLIKKLNSEDGENPLALFPKEIWLVLLEKMGPEEKQCLRLSHDLFYCLTEPNKVQDILLPLMAVKHQQFFGVPPKIFQLVSKSLQYGVHRYYEKILLSCLGPSKTEDESVVPNVTFNIKHRKNIGRYIDSTFIRSITINLCTYMLRWSDNFRLRRHHVFKEFVDNITNLLDHVGHKIWKFECHASYIEDLTDIISVSEFTQILYNWLNCMPNLKWLQFSCTSQVPTKEMTIPVENVILPAPRLNELKRIDINLHCFRLDIYQICNEILSSNSHATMVSLRGNDLVLKRLMSSQILQFPNLESVALSHLYLISEQNTFNSLLQYSGHLKSITLKFDKFHSYINSLFRSLERLQSLEDLSLRVTRLEVDSKKDFGFLRLPNLSNVKIDIRVNYNATDLFQSKENVDHFFSLQFLLHCWKLRRLEWSFTNGGTEMKAIRTYMMKHHKTEDRIDFMGGWRDLNDSNIWKVFPCLEYVKTSFTESFDESQVKEYRKRKLSVTI